MPISARSSCGTAISKHPTICGWPTAISVRPTPSNSTQSTPNSRAATGFRAGRGRPTCRRSRRICSTRNPFCDRSRRSRSVSIEVSAYPTFTHRGTPGSRHFCRRSTRRSRVASKSGFRTKHGDALIFHSGDCDQNSDLATDYEKVGLGKQDGIIGRAWFTGIPAVLERCADDPSPIGRSAAAAGMDAVLAMPFIHAGQGKAIIAWYF